MLMQIQKICLKKKKMEKDEVCGFCIVGKYAIKSRASKICMQQFPEHFKDKMMRLDVSLRDKLFFGQSFFIFSGGNICIYLDNPLENYVFSTN